jgi:hypothetical protein
MRVALRDWLAIRLLRWGVALISPERFAELLELARDERPARHLTEPTRET